ncbi:MAG TPA: lipid-binding SYLF domain-containing protein [Casimicrobiaceae bacterium]|nr:lipid-binding SYLF domain-containing protein [Casimicrobiaceae bacterium]
MAKAFRWLGLLALVSLTAWSEAASAQTREQDLVDSARATFESFMSDPNMTWLQQHVGAARGVLIAPQIFRAGFIFGGAGGRAVLLVRDDQSGRWEGPGFYNLATANVGLQAGVAMSEAVTLVMTDKGINSLLADSVKLGGDATVAAGPVGAGAQADITTDFVAFTRDRGLYGGLNLDGTFIGVANGFNEAYYGLGVLPPDILLRASVHNSQAERLAEDVSRAAAQRTGQR